MNDKVKELNQLIDANTTSFDTEALRTKIQELQAELETANNTLDENAEAIANYSTLVTTVANINKQIDADTTELGADDLITKFQDSKTAYPDSLKIKKI